MQSLHNPCKSKSGAVLTKKSGDCGNGEEVKVDPVDGKDLDETCCWRKDLELAPRPTGNGMVSLVVPNTNIAVQVDVKELVHHMQLQGHCQVTVNGKTWNLTLYQLKSVEKAYREATNLTVNLCQSLKCPQS